MKKTSTSVTTDNSQYEKKSKKKFIIILILSSLFGGVLGFFMAFGADVIIEQFSDKAAGLLKNLTLVQIYILPWLMLIITIICAVINNILLRKSKSQIQSWDGEDDEYINVADNWLNHVSLLTSIWFIGANIFFAVITYNLFHTLETKKNAPMFLITVLFYFGGFFITIFQQSRMVKLFKQYAPEKKGSVYDTHFQEVWLESCDEAERHLIYQVAYKTFQFMNKMLSVLLTATTILGMFFPIGILCAFLIGVIWLIMTCYYLKESRKLEKQLQ